MQLALLSLLVLGVTVASVQGLTCYNCNYTNLVPYWMPFCSDPFDEEAYGAKEATISCNGTCIAEKGRIYYDGGYVEGISRGCANDRSAADCDNACGSTTGASGCSHCCDTDLCNGACPVTFNLVVVAAMLVLSLAFYLKGSH